MEEFYLSGYKDMVPNALTFGAMYANEIGNDDQSTKDDDSISTTMTTTKTDTTTDAAIINETDDSKSLSSSSSSTVTSPLTSSGTASDKAVLLLQQLESMHQLEYETAKPNTFVYNAGSNCFVKSNSIECAERAMELLSWMERQQQQDGKERKLNYNDDNNTAKDSDEDNENDDTSSSTKNDIIEPNVISYSTCINVYANSGTVIAGQKAD